MYSGFAVISSFFMAIILSLLPMPEWAIWVRPAWVLLVLIYWTMAIPYRVNIGSAWILGMLLDLLDGTLLGEHALALIIPIYFVSRMQIRLRIYPLLQQSLCIFCFALMYQFTLYCIQGFVGVLPNSYMYWLSSVTSMVLWPWLYVLLRDWHQRFKIV